MKKYAIYLFILASTSLFWGCKQHEIDKMPDPEAKYKFYVQGDASKTEPKLITPSDPIVFENIGVGNTFVVFPSTNGRKYEPSFDMKNQPQSSRSEGILLKRDQSGVFLTKEAVFFPKGKYKIYYFASQVDIGTGDFKRAVDSSREITVIDTSESKAYIKKFEIARISKGVSGKFNPFTGISSTIKGDTIFFTSNTEDYDNIISNPDFHYGFKFVATNANGVSSGNTSLVYDNEPYIKIVSGVTKIKVVSVDGTASKEYILKIVVPKYVDATISAISLNNVKSYPFNISTSITTINPVIQIPDLPKGCDSLRMSINHSKKSSIEVNGVAVTPTHGDIESKSVIYVSLKNLPKIKVISEDTKSTNEYTFAAPVKIQTATVNSLVIKDVKESWVRKELNGDFTCSMSDTTVAKKYLSAVQFTFGVDNFTKVYYSKNDTDYIDFGSAKLDYLNKADKTFKFKTKNGLDSLMFNVKVIEN